jgi:hypothetical protein
MAHATCAYPTFVRAPGLTSFPYVSVRVCANIAYVRTYSAFCQARNYRRNLVASLGRVGPARHSRAGDTGFGIVSYRHARGIRQALRLRLSCVGAVFRADLGSARGASAKAATPSRTLFGTLDTSISTVATEKRAGLSVAMFELDWASIEPHKGVFSESYIAALGHTLWKFRAEEMRVTLGLGLGLGLEDPPSWVYSLPDSSYVSQFGQVSHEATSRAVPSRWPGSFQTRTWKTCSQYLRAVPRRFYYPAGTVL